jgi:hypothetical protein
MATKSTLEAQNVALRAQLAQISAQVEALTAQSKTTAAKPEKAAKPLVARGYFSRLDEPTGKWVADPTRPCLIIAVPGAKPRKVTEANFAKELELHDALANAYANLA